LRRPVSIKPFGSWIPTGDDAIQGLANDRILGEFHDRSQAALRLLDALVLGDVGADGDVLNRLSRLVENGEEGGIQPVNRTVLGAVAEFAFPDMALCDGRPEPADELFGMVAGVDDAMVL